MSDLEEDDFPTADLDGRLSDTELSDAGLADTELAPIPDGWDDKPTFRDQGTKIPESVTQGPPTTRPLNLSVKEDLDFLNDLQKKAHDPSGPRSVILGIDRQFYNGSWYVHLTYSRIIYLKL